MKVYCSGPLFCAEEVGGMSVIAKVLEEKGMQTFLPHRDGLESYVMRFGNVPLPSLLSAIRESIDYAIFSLDVYELIECCDAVVCNLNGRVPDEGMIVEASLAYAAGKPIVLYKNDVRSVFGGSDNAMLTSLTNGKIVGQLDDLPGAVDNALLESTSEMRISDNLKKAIRIGKRISRGLEVLPKKPGKQKWSDKIISDVILEALS